MYLTKAQYAKMRKAQARRVHLLAINHAIGMALTAILFASTICLILVIA